MNEEGGCGENKDLSLPPLDWLDFIRSLFRQMARIMRERPLSLLEKITLI